MSGPSVTRGKTARGFTLATFLDLYGKQCSLQISSLASEDAIWLGIDDAEPKVMASQAASVGVQTTETTGWVPYPVPPQVQLVTRMHLSRDAARWLAKELRHFAKTGELSPDFEAKR